MASLDADRSSHGCEGSQRLDELGAHRVAGWRSIGEAADLTGEENDLGAARRDRHVRRAGARNYVACEMLDRHDSPK
jgi:hypothetical protein